MKQFEMPVDVRNRNIFGMKGLLAAAVACCVLAVSLAFLTSPVVQRDRLDVTTVTSGVIDRTIDGVGDIEAMDSVMIATEDGGRVSDVLVVPGQKVSRSTPLVRLENRTLRQEISAARRRVDEADATLTGLEAELGVQIIEAEGQLDQLRIDSKLQRLEFDAMRALHERGIVSGLQFQKAQALAAATDERIGKAEERLVGLGRWGEQRLVAARQALRNARADVDELNERLAALTVRAEFDGEIVDLGENVAAGAVLAPGSTVLRLSRGDRFIARVRFPAAIASELAVGQTASVTWENGGAAGVITQVDSEVNQDQISCQIALRADDADNARAGLPVSASVVVGQSGAVTYIESPRGSLTRGSDYAFVLEDDRLSRRKVEWGEVIGGYRTVVRGLEAGERVVNAGVSANELEEDSIPVSN